MKSKMILLPRMAVNNIRKNSSTYFPYIGVSIFAMFTQFVFDLIRRNDIMKTLPRAAYAVSLVAVGFILLEVILVPFLYYTNSFLIKRRKKELGLYSILGLEKKHIGIMMFWESVIVYLVVTAGSIALGLLFSRLIFLLLLNLARMPVRAEFSVSPAAVTDTLLFYAVVTGINLFVNLVQVGKARPVELMSDTRRGEKEPKRIGLWSAAGLLALGTGYYIAVKAELDSMIFTNFFLAVFLVVMGTYFLFTSGSIALLRFLKRRKKYYYRADNFVTVSGMLYRMKKNAASLSNICIFGTMTIITVVCTVSIWLGMESVIRFSHPQDFEISFLGKQDDGALMGELAEMAEENGIKFTDFYGQEYVRVSVFQDGNQFRQVKDEERFQFADYYPVNLMTVEAYNRMEKETKSLETDEAMIFSSGPDFGFSELRFGDSVFAVKEELQECIVNKKAQGNRFEGEYMAVLADEEELRKAAAVFGVDADDSRAFRIAFTAEGESQELDSFLRAANQWAGGKTGFAAFRDYRENMEDMRSLYGGLMFIGIFFGAVFLICLLVIMYYKQITEGFEDMQSFEIMQKVGMSDEEIRRTIKKQIRLVFALPLAGAVLHTAVGMNMVLVLMAAIGCFEVRMMVLCTAAVCLVFAILYCICYKRTSMAYYRIVRGVR